MIDTQPTNALFPAKRRRFFGSNLDLLTMSETLEAVESIIHARKPTQHVVINVAKLVRMQKDARLREIVNSCPLVNADGQGVVWGAQWLHLPVPERVAGIDLFGKLMHLAGTRGYKVYFFGAKDEVIKTAVEKLSKNNPGMIVAGYRNGYYDVAEEQAIVSDIRSSGADMLFVGMSSPKKEYFLSDNLDNLGIPFVMGVGGTFDIVAGLTKRAPVWMQKAGLEWSYRILNEPQRMTGRYVKTNAMFFVMLMKALIFGKKKYGCE